MEEWQGPLGGTMQAKFMANVWQRRPLVVRGAFPGLVVSPLVMPEDLARLASAPLGDFSEVGDASSAAGLAVTSRLVQGSKGDLRHGPFEPSDLAWALGLNLTAGQRTDDGGGAGLSAPGSSITTPRMPPRSRGGDCETSAAGGGRGGRGGVGGCATLLVSDVERVSTGAHELAEAFSCVPTWRHDDVMASYSPEKGSGLGAHVDDCDVVLVQVYMGYARLGETMVFHVKCNGGKALQEFLDLKPRLKGRALILKPRSHSLAVHRTCRSLFSHVF